MYRVKARLLFIYLQNPSYGNLQALEKLKSSCRHWIFLCKELTVQLGLIFLELQPDMNILISYRQYRITYVLHLQFICLSKRGGCTEFNKRQISAS